LASKGENPMTIEGKSEVDISREALASLLKAANDSVRSPFPAACNNVLGEGYQMPLMCAATGGECKMPCKKVGKVNAFAITFLHPIDFAIKRSNTVFVLTRLNDVKPRLKEGDLEFVVLEKEMQEHEFYAFPILAFSGEYKGKSTRVVKVA